MPPQVKDKATWRNQVLAHRRALLELLIAEFPNVLKTHRSAVEFWRFRLKAV